MPQPTKGEEYMHSKGRRALKLALLEEYGYCYWCKRLVKDYGAREPGARDPDDMATVDHLVSRYYRKKGDIVDKVLACNKCNQARAREEDKLWSQGNIAKKL